MPEQPTKGTAALYLEIPHTLRERLDAFVRRTRRTLKGEVTNAIEQYLEREEGANPLTTAGQADAEPSGQKAAPKKGKGRK